MLKVKSKSTECIPRITPLGSESGYASKLADGTRDGDSTPNSSKSKTLSRFFKPFQRQINNVLGGKRDRTSSNGTRYILVEMFLDNIKFSRGAKERQSAPTSPVPGRRSLPSTTEVLVERTLGKRVYHDPLARRPGTARTRNLWIALFKLSNHNRNASLSLLILGY